MQVTNHRLMLGGGASQVKMSQQGVCSAEVGALAPCLKTQLQSPNQTYIHQLCEDTGCHLKDLLIGMDSRRESKEYMP